MAERIDTAEAARRLGVRRESLYAYVSRGLLTSHKAPGTRKSWFDADDVARLAGQSQARRGADRPEVVVDSAITLVDPEGWLYYRGLDAAELARSSSFEEVAELLWTGHRVVEAPFEAPGELSSAALRAVAALGRAASPAEQMRVAVAAASVVNPPRRDRSPEGIAAAGRRILAIEVAAAGHSGEGEGSIAQRLFLALAGRAGEPYEVAALDAALVLLADHELASSTLAARVAASTWADPYLVVCAGLAVAGGPLHGGAGDRVAELLREASRSVAEIVLDERLRRGETVPGFGHPLYRAYDPRAAALWLRIKEAWPEEPLLDTARAITARLSPNFANIDFALGVLVSAAGMRPGSAEAIFTVARTAGWLAHAIEEYGHGLRLRLRAAYGGPRPGRVGC